MLVKCPQWLTQNFSKILDVICLEKFRQYLGIAILLAMGGVFVGGVGLFIFVKMSCEEYCDE